VFAHYQSLIRLRHELSIVTAGTFAPLMEEDPQIWAYTRTDPTGQLIVIANCRRQPRTVDVEPQWMGATLLLGNLPDAARTITSPSLELAAWDARMYLVGSSS
jgi:oligo-1,6-glucosidase